MEGEALKRILGLDVGESRIGVAVADSSGIIVSPLAAIKRSNLEDDLKAVVRLAEDNDVRAVVVGLPISLNGRMERQARIVRRFILDLVKASPVPVPSPHEKRASAIRHRLRSSFEPTWTRNTTADIPSGSFVCLAPIVPPLLYSSRLYRYDSRRRLP